MINIRTKKRMGENYGYNIDNIVMSVVFTFLLLSLLSFFSDICRQYCYTVVYKVITAQ